MLMLIKKMIKRFKSLDSVGATLAEAGATVAVGATLTAVAVVAFSGVADKYDKTAHLQNAEAMVNATKSLLSKSLKDSNGFRLTLNDGDSVIFSVQLLSDTGDLPIAQDPTNSESTYDWDKSLVLAKNVLGDVRYFVQLVGYLEDGTEYAYINEIVGEIALTSSFSDPDDGGNMNFLSQGDFPMERINTPFNLKTSSAYDPATDSDRIVTDILD